MKRNQCFKLIFTVNLAFCFAFVLLSCKKKSNSIHVSHTSSKITPTNNPDDSFNENLLALADVSNLAFQDPSVQLDFVTINKFTIPALVVAFQGQDFFVYEFCNSDSPTPCPTKSQTMFYSPLDLDPGTYTIRVKTCINEDRTDSGKAECGDYSDAISVEMPKLDEDTSKLLSDYHNAVMSYSNLSEEFFEALDFYLQEVQTNPTCRNIDNKSWSSLLNFKNAGSLYFQEFLMSQASKASPSGESTTDQLELTDGASGEIITDVTASYDGASIKDGKAFTSSVGGTNGLKAYWESKQAKTAPPKPAAERIASGDPKGQRSENLVAISTASLNALEPLPETGGSFGPKPPASLVLTLGVENRPDVLLKSPEVRIPFADEDFVIQMRKKQILAEMNFLKTTGTVTSELAKAGDTPRKSFTFDDIDSLMAARNMELAEELGNLLERKVVTSQITPTELSAPAPAPAPTPAPVQQIDPVSEPNRPKAPDNKAQLAELVAKIEALKSYQKASLPPSPPLSPVSSDGSFDPSGFDDSRSISTAASDPREDIPTRTSEVNSRIGQLLDNIGPMNSRDSARVQQMMDLLDSDSKSEADFKRVFGTEDGKQMFDAFTNSADPRRVKANLFGQYKSILTNLHATGKLSLNGADGKPSKRIIDLYQSSSIDQKMKVLACAIYEHKVAQVSDADAKARITRANPKVSSQVITHILENNSVRVQESVEFKATALNQANITERNALKRRFFPGDIPARTMVSLETKPPVKIGRLRLTDDTQCPASEKLEATKQKIFDQIKTLEPQLKALRNSVDLSGSQK